MRATTRRLCNGLLKKFYSFSLSLYYNEYMDIPFFFVCVAYWGEGEGGARFKLQVNQVIPCKYFTTIGQIYQITEQTSSTKGYYIIIWYVGIRKSLILTCNATVKVYAKIQVFKQDGPSRITKWCVTATKHEIFSKIFIESQTHKNNQVKRGWTGLT